MTPRGEYKSWGEWLDFVNQPFNPPKWNLSNGKSQYLPVSWFKSNNFADALSLARNGYFEVADEIKKVSDIVVDKVTSIMEKEEIYLDVFSPIGTYDMPSVIAGNPENAINFTQVTDTEQGKIVHVVVQCNCASRISPDTVIARGITVVSLIAALEYVGIRTKVTVAFNTEQQPYFSYIHFKNPEDDLDIPLLAFVIAHPSSLRRINFRALEIYGYPDSGYGRSQDLTKEYQGDIYFPCIAFDDGDKSPEYVASKIIPMLEKQGVKVNP